LTDPGDTLSAANEGQIVEALAWATANAKRVEVRGAGTKADVGCPVAPDLTIDMLGLSGVIDYAPAELVLTARAGTTMAELERLVDDAGQMLAFEPMDYGPLLGGPAGAATLGGVMAANASGPRRLKDGAARDHFLGFQAVSGRGEAFKAGGKVVKNVTGYDLPKLLAGSWGTLAVLTELTLKVMPRPPSAVTLALVGLPDADAARAMSLAMGSPADVSGAAHLPAVVATLAPLPAAVRAGGAVTLLRLEGFGPSVEARARLVTERLAHFGAVEVFDAAQTAALWRWVRDVIAFADDPRPVWRITAPPMSGPAIVAGVQAEIAAEAFYDWAGGLIWLAAPPSPDAGEAVIRRVAAPLGGHAALIRAPALVRAAVAVFEPEPAPLADLSRRVKASFDPANVLNRGRMFSDVEVG
jgi:glycolate oxidase FAD binding subunit